MEKEMLKGICITTERNVWNEIKCFTIVPKDGGISEELIAEIMEPIEFEAKYITDDKPVIRTITK